MLTKVQTAISLILIMGLASIVTTEVAWAASMNTRPAPLNLSGANGEATLQEIFDGLTVAGPGIDAFSDQVPSALFSSADDRSAIASFVIELAGFAPENQFGIYSASDPSNRALIFGGPDTVGSEALISFLNPGEIWINGTLAADGFADSFGFYIHTPQGNTFFSEDSLNRGDPQALIYQGDDSTRLRIEDVGLLIFSEQMFIVAFEDLRLQYSDGDYNDLVALVQPLHAAHPIPEPDSAILFGLGALIIGTVVRKRVRRSI
jgi:hypothetical protein